MASGPNILALVEQSKGELFATNEYTALFFFRAVNLNLNLNAELDITLDVALLNIKQSDLRTSSLCEPLSFRPSNLNIELSSREATKLKPPFPARNLNFCTNLLPKEGIKLKPLFPASNLNLKNDLNRNEVYHPTSVKSLWTVRVGDMPKLLPIKEVKARNG